MRFDAYQFSFAGGRNYNEDAVGYRSDDRGGIFVVADGLGGHAHGEVASACVRDTLLENWIPGEPDRAQWFALQAEEANRRILSLQKEKGTVLKSTMAALAIDGTRATWAHAGDSRVYYLHRGWIQCVTEDHSVAYKKYKAGEISRDAISWDEDQTGLLRSLGGEDRYEPQIRVYVEPIESGDAFFLCSDGAWEHLKDGEIAIDLMKARDARQWAELLLLRMMDRITSGNDNLTLLTLMIR